jgi:hypothetical protein
MLLSQSICVCVCLLAFVYIEHQLSWHKLRDKLFVISSLHSVRALALALVIVKSISLAAAAHFYDV